MRFGLFRWRAPEARKQTYLETLLAREDHAKEVKLFGLGPLFLAALPRDLPTLFGEDRALTLAARRVGLRSRACSARWRSTPPTRGSWCARVHGAITLGDMTMYLLVFKQGQSALTAILAAIGGMYEDNLYLSNLYEFLGHQSGPSAGEQTRGPEPERRHSLRGRVVQLSGRARSRRCATSTCTSRPAASSRSSAKTAPARPR